MTNALKSLYGQGHADAGGKGRNQTVLTPPCILVALHRMWREGIELDPCAPPRNDGDPCSVGDKYWDGNNGSGLDEPWVNRTYCNPPYGELKQWMLKSYEEKVEHVMLVPLRPHRDWFRIAEYDAVAYLKPLRFASGLTVQEYLELPRQDEVRDSKREPYIERYRAHSYNIKGQWCAEQTRRDLKFRQRGGDLEPGVVYERNAFAASLVAMYRACPTGTPNERANGIQAFKESFRLISTQVFHFNSEGLQVWLV